MDSDGHRMALSMLSLRRRSTEQFAVCEMQQCWRISIKILLWVCERSCDPNRCIHVKFRISAGVHSWKASQSGMWSHGPYCPVKLASGSMCSQSFLLPLQVLYIKTFTVEICRVVAICCIFRHSSSIICPVLHRSEGAPVRGLPAQGTPIGRLSGEIHSVWDNIGQYLSYELTVWEIWPIFAVYEPYPCVLWAEMAGTFDGIN